MRIQSYKDLIVWQKSIDLVCEIYRITKLLPKEEQYGLCNQMQRAAVSIASNIAEGKARNYEKEFAKFLSIAQGSHAELETQIHICVRLEYLTDEQVKIATNLCIQIGRMLNTLISAVNSK